MSAVAGPKFFSDAGRFRAWLRTHAGSAGELLVGYWKVGSGKPSMTWSESVDEALCVGWIDGVRRRIDEASYSIRFTPRKPDSIWSAVNIAKVAQLRAKGRMTAAGEQAFARRSEAKSAVYAFEQASVAELRRDETARFRRARKAWAYWESCPPGYRKTLLHWVVTAKREETRVSRLGKLIEACAEGVRLR